MYDHTSGKTIRGLVGVEPDFRYRRRRPSRRRIRNLREVSIRSPLQAAFLSLFLCLCLARDADERCAWPSVVTGCASATHSYLLAHSIRARTPPSRSLRYALQALPVNSFSRMFSLTGSSKLAWPLKDYKNSTSGKTATWVNYQPSTVSYQWCTTGTVGGARMREGALKAQMPPWAVLFCFGELYTWTDYAAWSFAIESGFGVINKPHAGAA
ncbi:hypothetical protein LY78DRAFT_471101 [Colletotrichum sublineola]|nr:hypothetical protein LY78DRAFT_471101 [Colletotrichum sublineola]